MAQADENINVEINLEINTKISDDTTVNTESVHKPDSVGDTGSINSENQKVSESRKERLKRIKEQSELDRQKKMTEIIEAQKRAKELREKEQEERRKKIEEISKREDERKRKVEQRKKEMQLLDQEKNEGLARKTRDREARAAVQKQQQQQKRASMSGSMSQSMMLGSCSSFPRGTQLSNSRMNTSVHGHLSALSCQGSATAGSGAMSKSFDDTGFHSIAAAGSGCRLSPNTTSYASARTSTVNSSNNRAPYRSNYSRRSRSSTQNEGHSHSKVCTDNASSFIVLENGQKIPANTRHVGCFLPYKGTSSPRVKGVLAWRPPSTLSSFSGDTSSARPSRRGLAWWEGMTTSTHNSSRNRLSAASSSSKTHYSTVATTRAFATRAKPINAKESISNSKTRSNALGKKRTKSAHANLLSSSSGHVASASASGDTGSSTASQQCVSIPSRLNEAGFSESGELTQRPCAVPSNQSLTDKATRKPTNMRMLKAMSTQHIGPSSLGVVTRKPLTLAKRPNTKKSPGGPVTSKTTGDATESLYDRLSRPRPRSGSQPLVKPLSTDSTSTTPRTPRRQQPIMTQSLIKPSPAALTNKKRSTAKTTPIATIQKQSPVKSDSGKRRTSQPSSAMDSGITTSSPTSEPELLVPVASTTVTDGPQKQQQPAAIETSGTTSPSSSNSAEAAPISADVLPIKNADKVSPKNSVVEPVASAEISEADLYKMKLAEQKRLAREKKEKKLEEQRKLDEELRHKVAEERRKMEEEARILRDEEDQRQTEEEEHRQEELEKQRLLEEEEIRKREERQRIEAEKMAENVRLEDEERMERKRRLERIMRRVKRPDESCVMTTSVTLDEDVSPPPVVEEEEVVLPQSSLNEDQDQQQPTEAWTEDREITQTTTASSNDLSPALVTESIVNIAGPATGHNAAAPLAAAPPAATQFKSRLLQNIMDSGRLNSSPNRLVSASDANNNLGGGSGLTSQLPSDGESAVDKMHNKRYSLIIQSASGDDWNSSHDNNNLPLDDTTTTVSQSKSFNSDLSSLTEPHRLQSPSQNGLSHLSTTDDDSGVTNHSQPEVTFNLDNSDRFHTEPISSNNNSSKQQLLPTVEDSLDVETNPSSASNYSQDELERPELTLEQQQQPQCL